MARPRRTRSHLQRGSRSVSEALSASPSLLLSPLTLSTAAQPSSSSKRRKGTRKRTLTATATATVVQQQQQQQQQRFSFADEATIERIREHLQNAAEISEQEEGSSLKAPCGHAYLSRRTNAWHVVHCSRGGETVEIATLHFSEDEQQGQQETRKSRNTAAPRKKTGRRSKSRKNPSCPPVELVEALFMAKELRNGLIPTRRSIRGTRQAEERNNHRIRNQTNLVWMSRWGEATDVSGLLAAVSQPDDFRPLLSRILGNDYWDADKYQGWTICKIVSKSNEHAVVNGVTDNQRSSASVVTAEQEIDLGSTTNTGTDESDEAVVEGELTERSRSSSVSSSASSTSLAKSILGFVDRGIKFVFMGSGAVTEHDDQAIPADATTALSSRDGEEQDEDSSPEQKRRRLDTGVDVVITKDDIGDKNSSNLKPPPRTSVVRDIPARQVTDSGSKTESTVDGEAKEEAKKIDSVSPVLDYTSVSDHTVDEEEHKPEGLQHASSSAPVATVIAKDQKEVLPMRKSRRIRKGTERLLDFTDVGLTDKMEGNKQPAVEKAPASGGMDRPLRRGARTRGTASATSRTGKASSSIKDEHPARISARLRTRPAVGTHETSYEDCFTKTPATTQVRIKLKGWKALGVLKAAMFNKGISKKRRRSELETASIDFASEAIEDETTPGTQFVLSTSNRLSTFALAHEYNEISCTRHESCFPLKPFRDDAGATDAINSLWNELEELNAKHPIHEEVDEDFLSEQQLRNRTARILQGRRSQEKSIRHKEKEEAEQLANKLLQLANKRRAPPSTEELEWQHIVDRPLVFQGASTRRSKTITGKDTCPCTSCIATRGSDNSDQILPCRLCSIPAESERTEPVPFKNMMPRIRQIDVDAPEFLNRDNVDDPRDIKNDAKASKNAPTSARGSKRIKFDPKKRKETVGKLSEVRGSIDFVEQYNAGLLQEVTK